MTLKGGQGRKGRGGAATKDAKGATPKKKALKTIVREEIEVKPSKVYGLADEFRRPIGKKAKAPAERSSGGQAAKPAPKPIGPIRIGAVTTLGQFAEKIGISAADIIKKILMMGQRATINQLLDPDLAELIAQDMGLEIQVDREGDEQDIEAYRPVPNEANMALRPPVVTIMGHVDHGKTTLLDAFRSSSVVESEFGGITQHIGAYKVETPRGVVVFLDTPGHAAFTSMRARGAQVTDIVVLVVSADDGVMPQTIEAINHAREAGVPMIVAINKMDLPGANPDRVRMGLMQYGIVPEALGGDTIFVEISAKKRTNLDQLLELILLQSEVLELKADPTCHAEGTIIESHIDRLRGSVATVLVEQGTLRAGEAFVVGDQWGRVRVMIDDRGKQVREAGPSYPVEIIGLSGTPDVGEMFLVMEEERVARQIAELRAQRRRQKELLTAAAPRHMTLEDFHERVAEGKTKELKVILKADVQGSLEAVAQSIQKLGNDEVGVRILHQATGSISESDVALASASDAIIVGFNVRPDALAAAEAERESIDIKTYRIIYELIEDFQKALVGMLEKRFKEVELGRVEIRQIFKISRQGTIAGCMVTEGEVTRGASVRLVRDGVVVYQGRIATLRRMKDEASRVAAGYECGISLENFQDIKEGDVIEVYKLEEIPAELVASTS
jgi:translation initiation factor IF-2